MLSVEIVEVLLLVSGCSEHLKVGSSFQGKTSIKTVIQWNSFVIQSQAFFVKLQKNKAFIIVQDKNKTEAH